MRPLPPGFGTKKPGLHHAVGVETSVMTFFSKSISVTVLDSSSYALGTARAVATFRGSTSVFGLMVITMGESVLMGSSLMTSLRTVGKERLMSEAQTVRRDSSSGEGR